ncbi:UDP-N-acetylglucosamine--N-acetylmuramyl-(pentapeptide) pyrophosphoryl-undecaprenol N-acetylglucosamine transferase [Candidatus Cytomitobacter primus]|uniref:UDP-N-acetylglucosamine--N-acetylmuramyl-(Pentapeptide) pyrophosphoryl-undecaprenol N-acetylglucosamine transferase n=1 Tax=Candidatus Cytomitobacter primus TaxID=2066024 RepID=A0A5C0UFS9_9PROT|nr:glycosyltransferase [Candidatus Cytomitobacter primus]QEK38493.1 hypothetical protein FZC34_01010 [Candidatus Cytomitobacter primus]
MKNSTTIFVAGGTAGHVFAANGMAHYVSSKKIIFTDKRGEKYIDKTLFDEIYILPIKNNIVLNFYSFIKSFIMSWKIIKQNKNSVIIGFGAYVSIPTCIMGWMLSCPLYLYQADQIIGKANKILSYFAKRIFVASYNIQHKKAECIGLIPRSDIISYPINLQNELRILILGGSLSSAFLKLTIPSALYNLPKEILQKIRIHQQAGEDKSYFTKAYSDISLKEVILDEFIDTTKALPWSNFVIARAGMGTISDLTASMRPALLVPWSNAKDNHQTYNAQWWAKSGGGWWVPEHEFNANYLKKFIINLVNEISASSESSSDLSNKSYDSLGKENKKTELEEKSEMLGKWMPIYGGLLAVKTIQRDLNIKLI